ncbi:alpha/beta fold hydrolase [Micromonospora yangpuensis]|uniref:Lysophospholipase, alpha-beta hydrolase superfamily n=1 Tax=Micromonospora yangpuensis TaxID=683228 RepID=A0A1C6UNE5_9ACTN|nr:alpha/beta hydrolase [Micromonospora yangpuensis]GGM09629.1 alpha/beta hydrolase [Micromonospora yangpuensis]SCL55419.1 Lysophospholipase, alpha-beta hydrolase superfamily [Micromonospora yangpuensis]
MVAANGITLHVQRLDPVDGPDADRAGPRPTVVLIHGMASDTMASWYFTMAEPLVRAGFPTVLYDLRGHGRSTRPATGYTLDDLVDDLAALLAELAVTGPLLLFGNSFGGTIAFAYAARHRERVVGIVAVESAPPIPEWMRRVAVRFDRVATRLAQEPALAEIGARRGPIAARRAADTGRMLADTSLARELPASRLPSTGALAAIDCPVLCLYGGRSAVGELADPVRELLPQTRVVVLPDEKHSVLIDVPQTVRRHVFDWLTEQCGLVTTTPATP